MNIIKILKTLSLATPSERNIDKLWDIEVKVNFSNSSSNNLSCFYLIILFILAHLDNLLFVDIITNVYHENIGYMVFLIVVHNSKKILDHKQVNI